MEIINRKKTKFAPNDFHSSCTYIVKRDDGYLEICYSEGFLFIGDEVWFDEQQQLESNDKHICHGVVVSYFDFGFFTRYPHVKEVYGYERLPIKKVGFKEYVNERGLVYQEEYPPYYDRDYGEKIYSAYEKTDRVMFDFVNSGELVGALPFKTKPNTNYSEDKKSITILKNKKFKFLKTTSFKDFKNVVKDEYVYSAFIQTPNSFNSFVKLSYLDEVFEAMVAKLILNTLCLGKDATLSKSIYSKYSLGKSKTFKSLNIVDKECDYDVTFNVLDLTDIYDDLSEEFVNNSKGFVYAFRNFVTLSNCLHDRVFYIEAVDNTVETPKEDINKGEVNMLEQLKKNAISSWKELSKLLGSHKISNLFRFFEELADNYFDRFDDDMIYSDESVDLSEELLEIEEPGEDIFKDLMNALIKDNEDVHKECLKEVKKIGWEDFVEMNLYMLPDLGKRLLEYDIDSSIVRVYSNNWDESLQYNTYFQGYMCSYIVLDLDKLPSEVVNTLPSEFNIHYFVAKHNNKYYVVIQDCGY